ncbi:MAG: sensor histidine kinase [Actinomycetota bacterium]|nr:sensor histidine kinase [Actinomycetota bacterium]
MLAEDVTSAGFSHEALLYSDDQDYLAGTVPFLREGVARGEDILVVVDARKIAMLRMALGAEATGVTFADMQDVGSNPARIIPAWQTFVDAAVQRGGGLRGIGEPIWAERTPAELIECQRHEALLNVAFAGTRGFRLLCPYDTSRLGEAVLAEAHCSHPVIVEQTRLRPSPSYNERLAAARFDEPLPEPPGPVTELRFSRGELGRVRSLTERTASEAGLSADRTHDVVLAVNEMAANSLHHGGGHGMLRIWVDGPVLICEIHDRGAINDPLVGRRVPDFQQEGGRGVWLAHQLCDLVQIRTFTDSNVVRLHNTLS